jgi:hypothetical protein
MNLEIEFENLNWFSLYNLHHRCVERFSEGRIFLARDAAHIHSPGLQDVHNLAWKFPYVIKEYYQESILESYHEERKPFADWLLRFTDRGFSFITNNNKIAQVFRNYFFFHIIKYLLKLNFVKHLIFKNLSQTNYNYRSSKLSKLHNIKSLTFQSGDRLPYVHKRYYQIYTAPSHYLIHIHCIPLEDEVKSALKRNYLFPVEFIENTIEVDWDKFGVTRETFILVRPDMYIEEVWQAGIDKIRNL